jgi:hypothetical protein
MAQAAAVAPAVDRVADRPKQAVVPVAHLKVVEKVAHPLKVAVVHPRVTVPAV